MGSEEQRRGASRLRAEHGGVGSLIITLLGDMQLDLRTLKS